VISPERNLYRVALPPEEVWSADRRRRARAGAQRLTTLQVLLLAALLVVALGLFFFAGAVEAPVLPGLTLLAEPEHEHGDEWLNCGIYREPVESEQANHSLKHGAVWISYRPDLPEADVAALEERVQAQDYLILSPNPGQRSPIVLKAWGVQLEAHTAGDPHVDTFIRHYRLGPTAPDRGGACSGGSGEPLGGSGEPLGGTGVPLP